MKFEIVRICPGYPSEHNLIETFSSMEDAERYLLEIKKGALKRGYKIDSYSMKRNKFDTIIIDRFELNLARIIYTIIINPS